MPFLRRRGNVASETDMRRHSVLDNGLVSKQAPLSNATDPSRLLSPTVPEPADVDGISQDGSDNLESRPGTPPVQDETPKHRRFSILRFRNASDSQLSLRAKQQAEIPPPVPRPPEIITTAPTVDQRVPLKKQSRLRLADRFRRSGEIPRHSVDGSSAVFPPKGRRKTGLEELASRSRQTLVTFEEPGRPASSSNTYAGHEEHDSTVLALPTNRLSESSRSDASSGNNGPYSSTTTTTATATRGAHPASSFFRLPGRRQNPPEPLFPMSHLPQKGKNSNGIDRPIASHSSLGVPQSSATKLAPSDGTPRPSLSSRPPSGYSGTAESLTSPSNEPQARLHQSPATVLFRQGSLHSGHSSPTRTHLQLRGRSSTMSSMGRDSIDDHLNTATTRTSSSTGRKSFGDLFGLSRLRQNSEIQGRQGNMTPATPGSNTSKNNSLQIAREPVVLLERREDDTPAKYLARLEEVISRGVIGSAVARGTDPFFAAVLRSYMRRFKFFGDPMDMAIRKLLMEAELPKETQQIDRFLQAFANRYHECNPGIYSSPDQAYFIAFSLLILHTDVFNKNNKHKMQKPDYLKNTQGEGIAKPILDCFYDNITYTPFIHVEDDLVPNGERNHAGKAKRKTIFPGSTPDTIKRSPREPIDPYTLILDDKLDLLRPSLKEVMQLEDYYSYLGTMKSLNLKELQKTFFRTGILQIISARSRPEAFRDEKTAINPQEAPHGLVDIKITKVGILWRKDIKKKKTRSPWQEWGAILTGAQLYFFRNTAWVKNLMHQYETHVKQGLYGEPITFKPPLQDFKPDALMSTDEAVALYDCSYKKHKHSFLYVCRRDGIEEVLRADDEEEMNDWLAKLNYAAAFRTSGVRMRGVVGGNYDGQSRRGIRRLDSSDAAQVIQTSTGEVSIARGRIDHKEAEDIRAARRQVILRKVAAADETLEDKEKDLEIELRNARHLQILSPIHAKAREQVLSAAALMAAQLKWIRMEIWRIRCHRDILLKDLEEEQQQIVTLSSPVKGQDVEDTHSVSPSLEKSLNPVDTKSIASSGAQKAQASPAVASRSQAPSFSGAADPDSPSSEVFETPPTSATFNRHKHQKSWDSSQTRSRDPVLRHRSNSSSTTSSSLPAVSSAQNDSSTPRAAITNGSSEGEQQDGFDAGERDVLEQAGLLEASSRRQVERKRSSSVLEAGDTTELREHPSTNDKLDRSKIRRSLQRTLREGAGHLSHHRSRKGKDSASSGLSEDTIRDDILSRGTGSFVVHGKKASVINFGSELQPISQEERLRLRKQVQQEEPPISPSSVADDDFHSALGDPLEPRERRESAASASTATARSFRELHRKYSSAQVSKNAVFGGRLSVPSDGESEAAVSFSDGRRTPLPPIDHDSSEDEDENALSTNGDPKLGLVARGLSGTPDSVTQVEEESPAGKGHDMEQLPSHPIQAVKA